MSLEVKLGVESLKAIKSAVKVTKTKNFYAYIEDNQVYAFFCVNNSLKIRLKLNDSYINENIGIRVSSINPAVETIFKDNKLQGLSQLEFVRTPKWDSVSDKYKVFNDFKANATFDLAMEDLKGLENFVSNDETRFFMQVYRLDQKNIVATNGRVLAIRKKGEFDPEFPSCNIHPLIPQLFDVKDIVKVEMSIEDDTNNYRLTAGDFAVCYSDNSQYPAYQKVIPVDNDKVFNLNLTKEDIKLIPKKGYVTFDFKEGSEDVKMTILLNDSETVLKLKSSVHKFESITFKLNGKFLRDCIDLVGNKGNISFSYKANNKALVAKNGNDTALLMPMLY